MRSALEAVGGRDEALRQLAALEAACQGTRGGRAVMRAMCLCAVHELDQPAWLRAHFIRRVSLIENAELSSWDEALGGRPWPKTPEALAKAKQRLAEQVAVYHRIWELAIGGDRPLNEALFDEVAAEFRMSRATTERRYYAEVEAGRPSVASVRG